MQSSSGTQVLWVKLDISLDRRDSWRDHRRRRSDDGIERVSKAEALVHMGEVSSARQALEGSSLAPWTEATLNALRDES